MMQIFAKKKNTATGSVELKETSDLNEHILNIITPSGIDYDSTHANIGENVGKIYCISRYPAENIKYGLSLIHISEPTRRTPISYAVFCLKKKKKKN